MQMNGTFLIDGEETFTYNNLLEAINSKDYYYPNFQNRSLFAFFTNLVLAITTNSPVTLVDSDFSKFELENLLLNELNEPKRIKSCHFESVNDLISSIRQSTSTISIYTSGTTGQPKKVEHSYQNLARAVKTGDKFNNNVWGFAYNPTHMAGLQVFFQAFENENALVNLFYKPKDYIVHAINRYKITHISATPTFYRLLLPTQQRFESIERITLGGERSDGRLYDSIHNLFPNAVIHNVYASTEAGTLFASRGSEFIIPERIKDKIKVVDNELFIHESLLGTSNSLIVKDHYYASGDLIEWVDEKNGIFQFKSRKNELINVGGYKVNPQEVEEAIREIPDVIDVHVFGRSNSILGNVLCADIVKNKNPEITEIYIRHSLTTKLQDYKIPRRIVFKDALETTRTGKMKRV